MPAVVHLDHGIRELRFELSRELGTLLATVCAAHAPIGNNYIYLPDAAPGRRSNTDGACIP